MALRKISKRPLQISQNQLYCKQYQRDARKGRRFLKLQEKTLTSTTIYDGKVLHVCRDTVLLPNGVETGREYIRHVGAVAVLALTDAGEVILERQYRYPFHDVLVEIPAGKLNAPDEDPAAAARRELQEETGLVAGTLIPLGDFYGSPAILGERLRLFLATDLTAGRQHTDDDEFLEVFKMPLADLIEKILAGNIPDGKTQAAALRVREMLRRKETT